MTITLRDASECDIPAIFDVRTSVTENHLSVAQMAVLGITHETIRQALRQHKCIWVAESGGQIVGFAMADIESASVFAAFVRSEWEGQGIGRRLMQQAESFLFAHHSLIWLNTAGSSRAARFYGRLGWVPVQSLPNGEIRFEKHRS